MLSRFAEMNCMTWALIRIPNKKLSSQTKHWHPVGPFGTEAMVPWVLAASIMMIMVLARAQTGAGVARCKQLSGGVGGAMVGASTQCSNRWYVNVWFTKYVRTVWRLFKIVLSPSLHTMYCGMLLLGAYEPRLISFAMGRKCVQSPSQ